MPAHSDRRHVVDSGDFQVRRPCHRRPALLCAMVCPLHSKESAARRFAMISLVLPSLVPALQARRPRPSSCCREYAAASGLTPARARYEWPRVRAALAACLWVSIKFVSDYTPNASYLASATGGWV